MHIIIDINGQLVEVQIRTELQHLWSVLSETWADAVDQSIKYGGGPPEIQENLKLKAEIVALIESGQRRLLADLNKRNLEQQSIQIGQLHELLSTGQLLHGAVDTAGLVCDYTDLLRREREMKERFNHDILEFGVRKAEFVIFLIEYDRPTRRTLLFKTFGDVERHVAQDERLRLELELNQRGLLLDHEVVLLEARDEQHLRRTHDRYFEYLPEPVVPSH